MTHASHKYFISRACIILFYWVALGFCLASCSPDDPFAEEDADGNGKYMRIVLSMPRPTRSNPTGGEYGDGYDYYSEAEIKIDNLTLFFYKASDGPDGPSSTLIDYAIYVDSEFMQKPDGTIEKTILLKDFIPVAGHRVIVAANYGNISHIETLGGVRNFIAYDSWQQDNGPESATSFTMANAYNYDGVVAFKNGDRVLDGSADNPLSTSVTLERTAAKIDIRFPDSAIGDELGLDYKAGDKDSLILADILPVNIAQAPAQLMKCVTLAASDDLSCFNTYSFGGNENIDANGAQLNYVVEPKTAVKSTSTPQESLSNWYGKTSVDYVSSHYDELFAASGGIASRLAYAKSYADDKDYSRLTLSYANENTQHASLHLSRFLTGILIKAIYRPEKVFADASLKEDNSYSCGKTFYRYAPDDNDDKAVCFSSLTEAEKYRDLQIGKYGHIETFENAVCYYHAFIRHSRADNVAGIHQCDPMEYAIVRNNVYILTLKFTGPGAPTPDFNNPESLILDVFVRPWNLRRQSTLLL